MSLSCVFLSMIELSQLWISSFGSGFPSDRDRDVGWEHGPRRLLVSLYKLYLTRIIFWTTLRRPVSDPSERRLLKKVSWLGTMYPYETSVHGHIPLLPSNRVTPRNSGWVGGQLCPQDRIYYCRPEILGSVELTGLPGEATAFSRIQQDTPRGTWWYDKGNGG